MKPVIVIGAPRSGTNILRDVISNIDGVCTWPCDEINYIWRYGNSRHNTDEFSRDMAHRQTKKYIRKKFHQLADSTGADIILEKTCANSLRVEFVDEIFPTSKFVYIVRDGIDVVGSSVKRWGADLDLLYILKKSRYVPLVDIPYYSSKYIQNRIVKIFSKDGTLKVWGPQFEEMKKLSKTISMEELCAIQWKQCVDKSEQAFSKIAKDRVYKLSYESFVTDPINSMRKVSEFIGYELTEGQVKAIVPAVSEASVGKGRSQLGSKTVATLEGIIGTTLRQQGYT